jgi:hypothetical protein
MSIARMLPNCGSSRQQLRGRSCRSATSCAAHDVVIESLTMGHWFVAGHMCSLCCYAMHSELTFSKSSCSSRSLISLGRFPT